VPSFFISTLSSSIEDAFIAGLTFISKNILYGFLLELLKEILIVKCPLKNHRPGKTAGNTTFPHLKP
jgi:hypothetical protein